jgi:hypothetical protein
VATRRPRCPPTDTAPLPRPAPRPGASAWTRR